MADGGFGEVEGGAVGFGAVVDGVGVVEGGAGWAVFVEDGGEVGAGGDDVVAVGEVDPAVRRRGKRGGCCRRRITEGRPRGLPIVASRGRGCGRLRRAS